MTRTLIAIQKDITWTRNRIWKSLGPYGIEVSLPDTWRRQEFCIMKPVVYAIAEAIP